MKHWTPTTLTANKLTTKLIWNLKHAFWIFPLLVVMAMGACSPSTPRCLKSNCAGCCDINGECQRGNTNFACGFGANTCGTCAQNESCSNGECLRGDGGTGGTGGGSSGGDGGCTPTTCGGCCDPGGVCRGGNTQALCGSRGVSCAACPSGQACTFADAGTFSCQTFVCTGCTSTTGNCLVGTSTGACGTGGGACRACLAGQSCVSGVCQASATCTSASCAGCCDGTVCVDPPTTPKCGRMGAACAACTGANVCNAGACSAGGTGGGAGGAGGGSSSGCGPANCPNGCCDPLFDSCVAGTDNLLCGKNGGSCNVCLTFIGFSCKSQACSL